MKMKFAMEIVSNILFIISNGLLIPVVLLLLFFFVRGVVIGVGFFSELSSHRRVLKIVDPLLEDTDMNVESINAGLASIAGSEFAKCAGAIVTHRNDEAYCERLIANYEVQCQSRLSRSRTLIKFGPMLGLMGTLIPMGPALVGLASGNIASMAYNMQMAFATTVVGMATAAIGVAVTQVNQRCYSRQLNDLEYICRKLTETHCRHE